MKHNRIYYGIFALLAILITSSCSSRRYNGNVAARDRSVYQSPDYYYTGSAGNASIAQSDYYADDQVDEYTDAEMLDEAYADNNYQGGYYEDEFSDLDYANRINRYHYATPGMMYYATWFDPWMAICGMGMGWGTGWCRAFGWGGSEGPDE